MKIAIKQVQDILKSKGEILFPDALIQWISIDSRSLQNNNSTLFFALVGDNHNGHDYITELSSNGVRNFVISQIPNPKPADCNFIVVPNTLVALQDLAAFYRRQFSIPVIAITGSNGKTIVKEWLSYLFAPDYSVIKSPKSYNSQVGVPLSVFGMNSYHDLGIFEAGISTISEMPQLQKILQPTIGVLINIGSAHDQGFESKKQKIHEKIQLFKSCKTFIYKKDTLVEEVLFAEKAISKDTVYFSWSTIDKSATVFIDRIDSHNKITTVRFLYKNESHSVVIPFIDKASIENAITCLVVLLSQNIEITTIQQRISDLYPVQMRLQVKPAINNCTLIDDSYSNDLQSLTIALDFLEQQKQHKYKTIIISDIEQSGLSKEELYSVLWNQLNENNIQKIITVGKEISSYLKQYKEVSFFETTDALINDISNLSFENQTILVKGARNFQFEKVVKALEYRKHETVLEVNLDAITHNLNFYKSRLQPTTKIMVMIKAFGYGNGGYELAKLLSYHRVDYLGVAFADEGIALKEAGINTPIMVMNPEISSFRSIVQHQLEPEIYNFRGLQAFLKVANELELKSYPIHIKLDTGMHRLGFESKDVDELIAVLSSTKVVQIKSILSHLAASDSLTYQDFTQNQIEGFDQMATKLAQSTACQPIKHIANTSGIINYPQAHFDMVRLGIGLYGIGYTEIENIELQNVSTLKSVISQIKDIPVGDSVGYSRMFVAQKSMRTATVPIGYADGVSRLLSNQKGYIYINNCKAPIVGNVCMDMLMVDVTDINCQEGDEVIIFGEQLSTKELALNQNTIPYEILTRISHRVKRIFYRS